MEKAAGALHKPVDVFVSQKAKYLLFLKGVMPQLMP
jgi:hypothetical protein